MKRNNSGNIAVRLSVMFGSIVLILVIAFVYYMFIKPEKLEINTVSYTGIDRNEYNVNSDELSEGLFSTINFNVDSSTVRKHEDLHDVYIGRDNPFAEFSDNREDIDTLDELQGILEEKGSSEYSDNSNGSDSNGGEEIIF